MRMEGGVRAARISSSPLRPVRDPARGHRGYLGRRPRTEGGTAPRSRDRGRRRPRTRGAIGSAQALRSWSWGSPVEGYEYKQPTATPPTPASGLVRASPARRAGRLRGLRPHRPRVPSRGDGGGLGPRPAGPGGAGPGGGGRRAGGRRGGAARRRCARLLRARRRPRRGRSGLGRHRPGWAGGLHLDPRRRPRGADPAGLGGRHHGLGGRRGRRSRPRAGRHLRARFPGGAGGRPLRLGRPRRLGPRRGGGARRGVLPGRQGVHPAHPLPPGGGGPALRRRHRARRGGRRRACPCSSTCTAGTAACRWTRSRSSPSPWGGWWTVSST